MHTSDHSVCMDFNIPTIQCFTLNVDGNAKYYQNIENFVFVCCKILSDYTRYKDKQFDRDLIT